LEPNQIFEQITNEQHEPNKSKVEQVALPKHYIVAPNSAFANGTHKFIYCSIKCKQKGSGAECP
jgi:hypothetical protein